MRVIYSARTVSSRIPALLELRRAVEGDPSWDDRGVIRGFANYLKLSGEGSGPLAAEADGSRPEVSPFEIALQSWQAFAAMERYEPAERDWAVRMAALEKGVVETPVQNVSDLSWKITALAMMNAAAHRAEIDAAVGALYRLQRDDGRYPYELHAEAAASDFVSFQAMYALAVAGRRPEVDARLAKLVAYALRTQRADGSWKGSRVQKGFDTPFRDTQFAVMGLSELFPGGESLRQREADEPAVPKLIVQLGDESKVVQRAAAVALRRKSSGRDGLAETTVTALTGALGATDTRRRWGALQVLRRNFRSLAAEPRLLQAVMTRLDDEAPANRWAAANAMGRWYPWRMDHAEERRAIFMALAARMGAEQDATVAGALEESVANLLDENLSQLREWQRTIRDAGDQQKVEVGLREINREQSRMVAEFLRRGNRTGRLRMLQALWRSPARQAAPPGEGDDVYELALASRSSTAVSRTRVGNDSEPVQFLESSDPALEEALLACLDPADEELAVAAAKAGTSMGDAVTPRFTRAVFGLLRRGSPPIRAAVLTAYRGPQRGRLVLAVKREVDAELVKLVGAIVEGRNSDELSLVLPLIAELGPGGPFTRDPWLTGSMERLLRDENPALLANSLRAASVFANVVDGPLLRARIMDALASQDPAAVRAAVDIVMERYVTNLNLPELTKQFLAASRGTARRMMIDEMDPSRFRIDLSNISAYSPPRAAVDLAQKFVEVRELPEVREALGVLAQSPNRRSRMAGSALRAGSDVRAVLAAERREELLDFDFFRQRVQPVLRETGADGKACVMCHATNARFPLRLPSRRGEFSEEETWANYAAAIRLVDLAEPRNSPILMKPTMPSTVSDGSGVLASTHNGGQRWRENSASGEYQAILAWIRGERGWSGRE